MACQRESRRSAECAGEGETSEAVGCDEVVGESVRGAWNLVSERVR